VSDDGFDLVTLGWDARWAEAFLPYAAAGLVPARVAIEFNHLFRLYTEEGEVTGQHAGRLLHDATGRHMLAAVGDWVAVDVRREERTGTIEAILPRRSQFSRKVAGDVTAEQVVAANIDLALLVMGLDQDFNLRRLERYLLLASESGATPAVLLTKADLAEDVAARVAEVEATAPGVPVFAMNALSGEGLAPVAARLTAGRTATLLGSSGAGKSTIINALAGAEVMKTQAVRTHDSRGRHTTRHRQLIVLPARGLIIDTPGMRELQLWDVSRTMRDTFDDITALAADCHFTDCQHRDEPRCAVTAAVADGRLAADRLDSYRKLQGELRSLDARKDERAHIDEKRRTKSVTKAWKKMQQDRGR
jgi:ribosome biogenesis GTPase / thiamine phosphate phosphatase